MPNHKLLFLAYYAPPVQVTGNIRRYHLLLEFKKSFNEVFLITSSNSDWMRKDQSLSVTDIHSIRVSTYDFRRLLHWKKGSQPPTLTAAFKTNPFFKIFRKLADSFPLSLLLDDGGLTYIFSAYLNASRLIKKHDINYLFSSFRPIADHLVAYLLKRKFPHLKWIADYRDLPVDPVRRNTFFPKFQNKWQRLLAGSATLVTTVSHGLAKTLSDYNNSIYVLPNAIPSISYPKTPYLEQKFRLTYTGSLYPGFQDPTPLFRAILDLKKQSILTKENFQVVYAGKDIEVWTAWLSEYGLQEFGVEKGLISYREALHLQNKSQLNLVLSWSSMNSKGVLTAKLGSYLAARKPILVILNGYEDEEIQQIITRVQCSHVVFSTDKRAVSSLRQYIEEQLSLFRELGPSILPEPRPVNPGTIGIWEDEVLKLLKHPKLEFYGNSSEPGTIPKLPNNV